METDFELRKLRYFVALAEELHFGRASERIGINESPLSKAITLMERRCGFKLFVRTRKATRLTPFGENFLIDARRVIAEADRARRNLDAMIAGKKGSIVVGVCDDAAAPQIAQLIAQSKQEDPEISIALQRTSLTDQLDRLHVGLMDVGFVITPAGRPARGMPDLDATLLSRDAAMLAMPPNHPLMSSPIIESVGDEIQHFMIAGDPSTDMLSIRQAILEIAPQAILELSSSSALMLTRVAAGEGLGILSATQAASISRRDIAFRRVAHNRLYFCSHLLKRANENSPFIARFVIRARRIHIHPHLC